MAEKAPKPFRPMKGEHAPEDLSLLRYPVLVAPKLDGVRCVVRDGVAISNSLKPLPNRYLQDCVRRYDGALDGLDGELIVGSPVGGDVINRTTSGIMSEDGEPEFTFHVFDHFLHPAPFQERHEYAAARVVGLCLRSDIRSFCQPVPHWIAGTPEALAFIEEQCVTEGYEGVMLRDPAGPYKHGKATVREGWLLKLKRFQDEEAEILEFIEQMTNTNEATTDARGLAKRSTAKAGKVAAGTLGAIRCRMLADGIEFTASGGTEEQAAQLWARRDQLIGKIAKIKHWGRTHPERKPRFPQFIALRHPIDMDAA